jgi:hypothetical protein
MAASPSSSATPIDLPAEPDAASAEALAALRLDDGGADGTTPSVVVSAADADVPPPPSVDAAAIAALRAAAADALAAVDARNA